MSARIYGLGSTFVLSPRLVSRGRSDQLVLQTPTPIETDEFGVDQMVRTWSCRSDLAEGFAPNRGDIDFLHRKLAVWDYTIEHGENWRASIRVKYNGFLKPRPIMEQRTKGLVEAQATLRNAGLIAGIGTPSANSKSTEITYLSPQCTFTYAVPSEPKISNFAGVMLELKDAYKIISRRGSTAGGIVLRGRNSETPEGFPYNTEVFNLLTASEQGNVWRCVETNKGLIVDPDRVRGHAGIPQ